MITSLFRLIFVLVGWFLFLPILADAAVCSVTAGFDDQQVAVSGLMVEVRYDNSVIEPVGYGDGVECVSGVTGALATFNAPEDEDVIKAGIIRLDAFSGPELFTCEFNTGDPAGEIPALAFDVLDAALEDLTPVTPVPAVIVTDFVCEDDGVGTGTDEGEGDGGSVGNETTEPEGGDGSAGACAGAYDITFRVDSGSDLASLQLNVSYPNASGDFVGAGESVECEAVGAAGDGFALFNDVEDEQILVAGYMTLVPFATPADVMRCRFDAQDGAPEVSDFIAVVVDASDAQAQPVDAVVSVSSIIAAEGNTGCSTCGDGHIDAGEECDDGNGVNEDGCLNDCRLNICGDGVLNGGYEECDSGTLNSDSDADSCRTDCTRSVCGDGVVDSGEECDDGNDDTSDACLPGCIAARCGDGFVQQGVETCDRGRGNSNAERGEGGCRRNCSLPDVCGDADGSGAVSATDAKVVLDNVVGLARTCKRSRCDVNGNRSLTATDARDVLNAAIGLGRALQCWSAVVFTLENEVNVGALQLTVDYAETGSTFVGAADDVQCTGPDGDDVIVSFNNDEDASRLLIALASLRGIDAPGIMAACSFHQPDYDVVESDFIVTVEDAVDVNVNPIADPRVTVSF